MKTKISHHSRIINLLEERNNWVCSTEFEYIRDHRKRISELNKAGYLIIGEPCNMHAHDSRLFMRRLVRKPKKIN